MLTFLRPRSFDLAQDADAMGLGGVGWGGEINANVRPALHKTFMLHQWGGVGWGDGKACSTLRRTLMLRPR